MVQAFERLGYRAEMIGTGQTAWMQGARYSMIMDTLINDFVSGEIEHAVAFFVGFANREPADGIAVKSDIGQSACRTNPQRFVHSALHNAEQGR